MIRKDVTVYTAMLTRAGIKFKVWHGDNVGGYVVTSGAAEATFDATGRMTGLFPN